MLDYNLFPQIICLWQFELCYNVFGTRTVMTGLDQFFSSFFQSWYTVFVFWSFLEPVPVLPNRARKLGPDWTFKHYTQQWPHNSGPAGFNDWDSYGPITTQQQPHSGDPAEFNNNNGEKLNKKSPRQH